MTDQTIKAFYQRQDILGETYEPMQQLRFTELATFMRVPLVNDLTGVDIGIVGIPYDGGLTARTGARYGPREVRNQSSLMRAINVATGARPFERAKVGDLGDVRFTDLFNLENAIKDIERTFARSAESRVLPLAVGGDHSVTYPILIWVGRLWPKRPNVLLGRARSISRLMLTAWIRPIRRAPGRQSLAVSLCGRLNV